MRTGNKTTSAAFQAILTPRLISVVPARDQQDLKPLIRPEKNVKNYLRNSLVTSNLRKLICISVTENPSKTNLFKAIVQESLKVKQIRMPKNMSQHHHRHYQKKIKRRTRLLLDHLYPLTSSTTSITQSRGSLSPKKDIVSTLK